MAVAEDEIVHLFAGVRGVVVACEAQQIVAGDNLLSFARDYNASHPGEKVDYFIFGHCHILLDQELPEGGKIVILGDWISRFTYAVWDGNSLKTAVYQ